MGNYLLTYLVTYHDQRMILCDIPKTFARHWYHTHVASDIRERTTIDSDVGFAKSKRHCNRQEPPRTHLRFNIVLENRDSGKFFNYLS
jgi:hypothetical protein